MEIADEPVLPEGMQYFEEAEDPRLRALIDRVMKSIVLKAEAIDTPVPVIRLEVEFDKKGYLQELAAKARSVGLITGFTIDTRETHYEWKGKPVRKTIFVLRTTIQDETLDGKPIDTRSTAIAAYQHFYNGIKEKWEVPLIYTDRSMAVNPDAARFLEREQKRADAWLRRMVGDKDPKVAAKPSSVKTSANVWTYVPNSPYINLWDDDIGADTHEECARIWERVYAARYSGRDELENPHLTVLATHRNQEGLIVPERSTVFVYGDIRREGVYRAISKGKGLREWDRDRLERGKYRLTFEFPDRDLSNNVRSLSRAI